MSTVTTDIFIIANHLKFNHSYPQWGNNIVKFDTTSFFCPPKATTVRIEARTSSAIAPACQVSTIDFLSQFKLAMLHQSNLVMCFNGDFFVRGEKDSDHLSVDVHLIFGSGGHYLPNDSPHHHHGRDHSEKHQREKPVLRENLNIASQALHVWTGRRQNRPVWRDRQNRRYQSLRNGRASPPLKRSKIWDPLRLVKCDDECSPSLPSHPWKSCQLGRVQICQRQPPKTKKTCILLRSSVILLAKSPVAVTSYHDKSLHITSEITEHITSNQNVSFWREENHDRYHIRSRHIIMSCRKMSPMIKDQGSIFLLILGQVPIHWFQTCLRTASKNLVLILNTCFSILIISRSYPYYPHIDAMSLGFLCYTSLTIVCVWFLLLVFKSWYSSYLSLCRIVEAGHKNVVSDPNAATFIAVSF